MCCKRYCVNPGSKVVLEEKAEILVGTVANSASCLIQLPMSHTLHLKCPMLPVFRGLDS